MSGITGGPAVRVPTAAPPQIRDAGYIDIYSNQLRLGATLTDMTLIFGVIDDLGLGNIIGKDKVAVHLAPGSAKLLLANLQAIIEAYESVLGNIPVPKSLSGHIKETRERFAKNYTDQLNAAFNPQPGG